MVGAGSPMRWPTEPPNCRDRKAVDAPVSADLADLYLAHHYGRGPARRELPGGDPAGERPFGSDCRGGSMVKRGSVTIKAAKVTADFQGSRA